MRTVYSALLLAVHAGAAGTITVEPGTVVIISDIAAFNPNAVIPETAALVHHPSSATIFQASNLFSGDPSSGGYVHERCHKVLGPGDSCTTNNGSDVDMFVSGYILSLP